MTDISDIQNPPNDYELEQKVLCALINNPNILEWTRLTHRDFFSSMNVTIYETLLEMKEEKKTIDARTLESELKKKHKRKNFWIIDISWLLVSYSSYEDDELRLIEYRKARAVISHSRSIIAMCNDRWDVSDINGEVDELLNVLSSADSKKIDMATIVCDAFESLDTPPDYVTTWYKQLDDILWGFSAWQLVIIAGRPWAGKTAAMMNMMYQQCLSWKKIGMFSLEMSTQELMFRLFSLSTGVPFGRIQSRKLKEWDKEKIADKSQIIIDNMEIVDDCFTLTQIKNKAKSMVKVHWCKLIYIDYLWLVSNGKPTANRNNEVSVLTRDLKMLAKQLGVPVLLWSQLNRAVEARVDKRPQLSDLRDSWSIEQDADCVIMLHRDDYYDTDSVPTWGIDFLIRKHRNWPVWEPVLYFEWHTMAIHNTKETPF